MLRSFLFGGFVVTTILLLPLILLAPFTLLSSLLLVGMYAAAFWFVVCAYYVLTYGWVVFRATPTLQEALQAQRLVQMGDELEMIKQDLEERMIVHFESEPARRASTERRLPSTLVNEGIAVNHRLSEQDSEQSIPGDFWLCEWRPVWFACMQIPPSAVLASLLALVLSPLVPYALITSSFVGLAMWTLLLGWVSYAGISENFRGGIKRFGRQLDGFLRPGFQLVLPFVEELESVSLQYADWGAHGGEDIAGQFHIGGTAGDGNPEPGKFTVPFLGYWPINFSMGVLLSVYESDKQAWNDYLNRYTHINEFGQTMARHIQAVLNRKAREVDMEMNGDTQDIVGDNGQAEHDPRLAVVAVRRYMNKLPETVGQIMQAVHSLGRKDRAGFRIRRIIMSLVEPGPELQKLLQRMQESEFEKFVQQQLGEAAAWQLRKFYDALQSIPAEERDFVRDMAHQQVVRLLYQGVSDDDGKLVGAALARVMTSSLVSGGQSQV